MNLTIRNIDQSRGGRMAMPRPMRFDSFTAFVQVLAWGAAMTQVLLILWLTAV